MEILFRLPSLDPVDLQKMGEHSSQEGVAPSLADPAHRGEGVDL